MSKKIAAKKSARRAKASAKKARGNSAPRQMTLEGYRGMHRKGSRKSDVHACFDKSGKDAALKLALRKGIKESSARRWLSSFGQMGKAKRKAA